MIKWIYLSNSDIVVYTCDIIYIYPISYYTKKVRFNLFCVYIILLCNKISIKYTYTFGVIKYSAKTRPIGNEKTNTFS